MPRVKQELVETTRPERQRKKKDAAAAKIKESFGLGQDTASDQEEEAGSDVEFTDWNDIHKNRSAYSLERIKEHKREVERLRKQQSRANMTPEQRDAARERNRIRNRQRRERLRKAEEDGQQRHSDSGSSEFSGQSSDEGGTQEEQEENLNRRRAEDRKRKQIARANFPNDALARQRELGRLRTQAMRAKMTPEEKEACKLKARLHTREKRANMTQEQKEAQRLKETQQSRERREKRRMEEGSELRLQRTEAVRRSRKKLKEAKDQGGPSDHANDTAQNRIIGRIDRTFFTSEEKKMTDDLRNYNWRRIRIDGVPTSLEPHIGEACAWKDLFLYEMKLEFQKERDIFVEEALEIELGSKVPEQQSPLQDPDWVLKLSETLSSRQTERRGQNIRRDIQDKDNAQNDDDDDMDAFMSAFNQVEVKIEPEDYEQWNGLRRDDVNVGRTAQGDSNQNKNGDDGVADWIARVITGEPDQSDDDSSTTPEDHSHNKASTTRDQASHYNYKVWHETKLRKTFQQARQRWVDLKPEDTEIRAKVDQERAAIKETVRAKKRSAVEKIVQTLIHQRDIFSQETEETRKFRIEKTYSEIASNLLEVREIREKVKKMTKEEIEEKRKKRLTITKPLSKEELQKISAAKAVTRGRMEKGEYEQHIDLLFATGFPVPPPPQYAKMERNRREKMMMGVEEGTCSVSRFEDAFKSDLYLKSMAYFLGLKLVTRTRPEVTSYRRMLLELLGKRRKRIDLPNNDPTPSSSTSVPAAPVAEEYEWIQIPESSSLEDMQRFKEFISKYGEPVLEHVTFKRFYAHEKCNEYTKKKFYTCPTTGEVDPEKKEEFRIKQNEYYRRKYIQKKFGITLGPGEYFDSKTMSAVKKPLRTYVKKAVGDGNGPHPKAGPAKSPAASKPKTSSAPRTRTPNTRKRGRGKASRRSTTNVDSDDGSRSDPQNAGQEYVQNSTSSRNDVDYSNSGDGVGHQDDDSNDGWVPLGSYEIDSVIRQDILNIPSGGHAQQPHPHQNFNLSSSYHALQQQQQQQFSSSHFLTGNNPTHHHHLRSGNSQHQQHQNYQQFSPQSNQSHNSHSGPHLQLVDQFSAPQMNATRYNSATGQWSTNAATQPLNYSLQFLPNSQISVTQNQQLSSHLASNPLYYQEPGANLPHLANPTGFNSWHQQNQQPHVEYEVTTTPTSSAQPEDAISLADSGGGDYAPSSSGSMSSTSVFQTKSRRGRPKGRKNKNRAQSSLQKAIKTITMKRNTRHPYTPGAPRRDIWNNFKRRKFYNMGRPEASPVLRPKPSQIESPFERNPKEMRDAALAENISLLLPKCPQCDTILDDDGALMRHMKSAHKLPPPDPVETDDPISPPAGATTEAKTRKSIQVWRNLKKIFPCSVCSTELQGAPALIEHWCNFHFEARRFKCPYASKDPSLSWIAGRCLSMRFESESLKNHIKRKHPEERKSTWIMGVYQLQTMIGKTRFCCIHCETFYSTYSELKEHYKGTHEKVKYCCVHCGIYLRTEDFWLDHVKLFHPEKSQGSVPKPIEVDSEDGFRCLKCDSVFSAQSFLDEHLAQDHTLFKGDSAHLTKSFPCEACDKSFKSEGQKNIHFQRYCKDKKYDCFWCKSTFASEDALGKHLKDAHPQEPPVPKNESNKFRCYINEPYKCEICRKSYINLHSLRLHCRRNHELVKYLQTIKDKYPPTPAPAQEISEKIAPLPKATPSTELITKKVETPPKLAATIVATNSTFTENSGVVQPPNVTLISCPICKTDGHNVHRIHKVYDKLMRRYCIPCQRLFARTSTLPQHNEAAHGMAPGAVMTYPPPCGHPGKIADIAPPNPEDWLECSCAWSFTKEEFHRYHLFSEKDPDVRVCNICSRTFNSPHKYQEHMHSDHGVPKNMKMVVYRTPAPLPDLPPKRELLEEDYEKLSSTTTMPSASGEITIYSCRVCLKNYKTQDFLRTHIEGNHKEDAFTRVMCTKCNTTFANKCNLAKHTKNHHSGDLKKYVCPVCQTLFSRMDHLKAHFHKLHPNHTYNRANVKAVPMEEALETGNILRCKICASTFVTESGLKSHMTNKHFPTHWSTFCEVCGLQMDRKALQAHNLKEHPTVGQVGVGKEKSIATRIRDRLCLSELIEMIQALYDKAGFRGDGTAITSTKKGSQRNARQSNTAGGRPTSKRASRKGRKRRRSLSSEESDGEDEAEKVDSANQGTINTRPKRTPRKTSTKMEAGSEEEDYEMEEELKPVIPKPAKTTVSKKKACLNKDTKQKGKSSLTKAATVTKSPTRRKRMDSCSEDEDNIFARNIASSGTRSRPARNKLDTVQDKPSALASLSILDKKLVIVLKRCDDEVVKHEQTNNPRQQNRKTYGPSKLKTLSKKSPSKNRNRSSPKSKRKSKKQSSRSPPIKNTEVVPDDLVVLDCVIKDEVDFDDNVRDDEDVIGVMEHNLDNLQWEYVQLPVSAELGEMEEDDDDDLPEFDPLSM